MRKKQKTAEARPPAHALKRCFRGLLLFVLLLLAAGYYLNAVGLPDALRDRLVRELGARGIHVKVARVRWEFLEGVVMDDLRYYAGPLDSEPLVRAEEATVSFRPSAWFKGRYGISGMSIRNATTGNDGRVSGMQANVRLEDQGLRVADLSANCCGLNITGGGYIARPADNLKGALVQAWQRLFPRKEKEGKGSWLPELLAELKSVRFEPGSSARVMLVLHPDDLNANEMTIEACGGGLAVRGLALDSWRMQAALAGGRITLSRLAAGLGERSLRLSGFLDLRDGSAACKLYSDLPPYVLMAFAPVSARRMLDASGVSFGDTLEISAEAGPDRLDRLPNIFRGALATKNLRLNDLPLKEASFDFSRDHQMIVLTNLQARIGEGRNSGPLSGSFTYNMESGVYGGQMETGFDPNWMCPLVSTGKARVISGLHFREHFPKTSFTFSGQGGDHGAPLRVEGSVKGRDFSFRGTYFTSAESKLALSNRVLNLYSLTACRDKTACRGRVSFDFENDVVDVDVESTFDPKAAARIMGPTLERIFRPFRFDGYSFVKARGSIDYAALTNMDLEAKIVTSNMVFRNIAFKACDFDFSAKGNRFEINSVTGRIYGGDFKMPRASLESLADSPLWHYELSCSAAGVDFGKLMQAYRQLGEDHPYEGKLAFTLGLSGETGERFFPAMRGRGDILISESRLLTIPFFGGLARILTALYPDFAVVSQNELSADFKINGNNIRTHNARLLGHIVSIEGKGRYYFTNKLDFKVRVRMLREGRLAAVLDLLTFPLTKLLEFHLGGPLEQPVWRPDNLPKELFILLKAVIPGVGDE